ncbi:MAG TPA: hypothetical protein VHC73_08725 [Vitreimonas sp.]|nr:hypothetical protein [Vitreimonas sp.]
MKLGPPEVKALRTALKTRTRAELKQLFALVRAYDDKTLLAALASPRPKRARRGDPLVRELERTLKPIMGPSAEKAELLIEFMAKKHRRKLTGEPKGLADAIKRLRTHFTDAQIQAGAKALLGNLKALYGDQETVV